MDTLFQLEPVCAVCGRLSTHLCDYPLGVVLGTRVTITCSKPLCEASRVRNGGGFICSRRPGGRGKGGGCEHFTYDLCPGHAGIEPPLPLPRMTLEDALRKPWPDVESIDLARQELSITGRAGK